MDLFIKQTLFFTEDENSEQEDDTSSSETKKQNETILKKKRAALNKTIAEKTESKGHDCNFCEYTTSRKSDLVRHTASKHIDEISLECSVCGKEFSQLSDLRNCMKTHGDVFESFA